jgi:hypothetical protein
VSVTLPSASVFAEAPYGGREALDAAVRAESRRPASQGRLGLAHDVQELASNPYGHRQEELLDIKVDFLPLYPLESILWSTICPMSLAAAGVHGF